MLEKRQHQRRTWLIILVLLWPAAASLPAAADINERFVGKVLFMRHALAPGFGDPDYFSIVIRNAILMILDGRRHARLVLN
jgi:hypothetical protein